MLRLAGAVGGAMLATAGMAAAQTPSSTLSLSETYGDWRVTCVQREAAKSCAMSQARPQKDGDGVVTIELATPPGGLVSGTAVLPFGLDLDAGIMIQVDDQSSVQATRFRTCVPAGCLVPVNLDAEMIAALRRGAVLKFHTLPDNDEDFHSLTNEDQNRVFAFSLLGLGAALDRVRVLSR